MRHRLRPVRPQHRSRLRLTLAALLLPLCAIVVLARYDGARRPLDEREAALAIDLQRLRRAATDAAAVIGPRYATWSAPTLSVVASVPRVVGNRELQLRIPGLIAGSLALGVLAWLGARLFAPRVGLASALVLLAMPSGRLLLGMGLGGEPFFALAMLAALLAMHEMAEARVAAVFAGVACGVAYAVAGLDAVWLPLFALAWLRVHQGLTSRSAGVIVGTTVGVALALLLLGWLAYGRGAGMPLVPTDAAALIYLDPMLIRPRPAALQLLPLLPLVLLGLWSMRSTWWQSESFRFVLLWLVFAAGSWAIVGSAAGAFVAILVLAVAIALLALEHARILLALPTCAVGLGIAVALWRAAPAANENQMLDRWAIRETARFVGRVAGTDRRVAASARAARRLAYYGNRPIEAFAAGAAPPAGFDYLILPREDFQTLREHRPAHAKGAARALHPRLKRIAEFGGWVVVRVAANDG